MSDNQQNKETIYYLVTDRNGDLLRLTPDALDRWVAKGRPPLHPDKKPAASNLIAPPPDDHDIPGAFDSSLPGYDPSYFEIDPTFLPGETFISWDEFNEEYKVLSQKHPYLPKYNGARIPYSYSLIRNESDYDFYLREWAFYRVCEKRCAKYTDLLMEERKALSLKSSWLDNDREELQQQEKAWKKRLDTTENSQRKLREQLMEYRDQLKRTKSRAKLFAFVFSVLCVFALFGFGAIYGEDFRAEGYLNGYDAGYDVGDGDGFKKGYAFGNKAGYNNGYSDGCEDGYIDGYLEAYEPFCDSDVSSKVIGNKYSHIFHSPNCPYLPHEDNRISFSTYKTAIDSGYKACGHCHGMD